jgi:hypothetical protein
MAETLPNPIPVYISGDASKGYDSVLNSSQTDMDGSDATDIYAATDPFYFVLVRETIIYSRGTNGGGTAHFWYINDVSGTKSYLGSVTIPASVATRGEVARFSYKGTYDSDEERMRGMVLSRNAVISIQIEDGSMSDGYRVHTVARDLTQRSGLQEID